MKDIRTLICILIISQLFAVSAFAQKFGIGVVGGYNLNFNSINIPYAEGFRFVPHSDFVIGIPICCTFTSHWAVVTEPSLVKKGYSVRQGAMFHETTMKRSDDYLTLPFLLQYRRSLDKWSITTSMGVYWSYWASARQISRYYPLFNTGELFFPVGRNKYEFVECRDNREEWGVIASVGTMYRYDEHVAFTADLRCYYGLTSQTKDYMLVKDPRYNTTFALTCGVLYCFKKKEIVAD